MNQIALDVTNPASPVRLAQRAPFQFCWGVAATGTLVVFVSSLGAKVGVYDPTTLAEVWQRSLPAQTHAVATDGANVFAAQEGTGTLLVLSGRNGFTLGEAELPIGTFGKIYATAHSEGHVYVADPNLGVVVFDVVKASAPAYVTHFGPGTSNIAVNKARLWISGGASLECWDVSNPAAPVRIGVYNTPTQQTNGRIVQPMLGMPAIDASGTRLYVIFEDSPDRRPSGFYVFDVTASTPRVVNRVVHQFADGRYLEPLAIAVDATGTVLALTSYYYGVEIWQRRAGDSWSLASSVPTAGECRDVYVDAAGNQTVLGRWVVTTKTAAGKLSYANEIGRLMEGWRPYVRGAILIIDNNSGGGSPHVYKVSNGRLLRLGDIRLAQLVTDVAYDGSGCLYLCGGGGFVSGRVSPPNITDAERLGFLPIHPQWVALNGKNEAWVAGPEFGVACVDVSDAAAMSVVFHDPTPPFQYNGTGNLCVAAGRVYAACGSAGVRIYNPVTRQQTGAISADPYSGKIFATWAEPYTSPTTRRNYLAVCHYGDGISYNPPEGLRLYSLEQPDAPRLVVYYPDAAGLPLTRYLALLGLDRHIGSPNFRCRAANGYIYRCALWGVEQLATHGL